MSAPQRDRSIEAEMPGGRPAARSTVRVGLIGLGYWGPNLLRVLAELEDVSVTRICDLDRSRLRHFCRRHPHIQPSADYREVLDDDEIDAVLIATPVQSHFALARESLRAGKHTFVEKPLASTTAEADALIAVADETGRVLMSGLTFLYSPPVRTIKEMLVRRELGDLYFISSSRVNLGPYRKDVSVVCDLAPHDFSMLLYWMEETPISVRAVGKAAIRDGIPDVAFITLSFASGVIANLEVSWIAPSKLRRTVIVGSKKMIVYEDGAVDQLKLFDKGFDYQKPEGFGEYQLSTRTGDIVIPKLDAAEPLTVELREFIDSVRVGGGSHESLTLSRDVVALIEKADQSMRCHAARSSAPADGAAAYALAR